MNAVSTVPGLILPLQQVAICTLPDVQSNRRFTAIASGATFSPTGSSTVANRGKMGSETKALA